MSAKQAGKQKEYKILLCPWAQEFPGYLLSKEEHMVMYPQEFIHWYTNPLTRKGYRQLPTWLPDELLKRVDQLPHNPNNIKPAPPAATDQIQPLEEGELTSIQPAAIWEGRDLFRLLTLSPAPLPILPHSAAQETFTPIAIPKEKAIDLEAPI